MEGGPPKGKAASAGDTRAAPTGASKYLTNLPYRGLFSSTVISSNLGGMRVYVCDRDTSPPVEQHVKTNQTNILIRSLTLKKQKVDSCTKDLKVKIAADSTRGKRSAERPVDGRTSTKRASLSSSNQREGSSARAQEEFQSLTVERLRGILKERGLSTKGKKDELIARLKDDSQSDYTCDK